MFYLKRRACLGGKRQSGPHILNRPSLRMRPGQDENCSGGNIRTRCSALPVFKMRSGSTANDTEFGLASYFWA